MIISEATLNTVRQMLCLGTPISQIARETEKWLLSPSGGGVRKDSSYRALREVFRHAFSLPVHHWKLLREWKSSGDGGISDVDLNTIMLSYIVRARDEWVSPGDQSAQWIMNIDVSYWERICSEERPCSVPETCWMKLDKHERAELQCLHNGAVELRFRSECLAAQLHQLSARVDVENTWGHTI